MPLFINLDHFTEKELEDIAAIRARVQRQRDAAVQENIVLRRMLLEAITCLISGRRPNHEFMNLVDRLLRLDKFG